MEAIIVIVGFLGAGKTTLLKKLIKEFLDNKWNPFVILNDYQNAHLDSQQFLEYLKPSEVNALSGSCICCSGVAELRAQVNSIPTREKGITLIEANGTSDACALMEFLGVGLKENFLPPIQISVVDANNWQKRDYNNELEANQVQVSSLVILNHTEDLSKERIDKVKSEISFLNPSAEIKLWNDLMAKELVELTPSTNNPQKMDHFKAHWASCSVDLPDPMGADGLNYVLSSLPESILRAKGCTRLDDNEYYSYFERIPSGMVSFRPYNGKLVTGPKLLLVGPGSDPKLLENLIIESKNK